MEPDVAIFLTITSLILVATPRTSLASRRIGTLQSATRRNEVEEKSDEHTEQPSYVEELELQNWNDDAAAATAGQHESTSLNRRDNDDAKQRHLAPVSFGLVRCYSCTTQPPVFSQLLPHRVTAWLLGGPCGGGGGAGGQSNATNVEFCPRHRGCYVRKSYVAGQMIELRRGCSSRARAVSSYSSSLPGRGGAGGDLDSTVCTWAGDRSYTEVVCTCRHDLCNDFFDNAAGPVVSRVPVAWVAVLFGAVALRISVLF